jgi:hypothetical protein
MYQRVAIVRPISAIESTMHAPILVEVCAAENLQLEYLAMRSMRYQAFAGAM